MTMSAVFSLEGTLLYITCQCAPLIKWCFHVYYIPLVRSLSLHSGITTLIPVPVSSHVILFHSIYRHYIYDRLNVAFV